MFGCVYFARIVGSCTKMVDSEKYPDRNYAISQFGAPGHGRLYITHSKINLGVQEQHFLPTAVDENVIQNGGFLR